MNSLIQKYRAYLPDIKDSAIVSLNEGNTPLVKAVRVPSILGIDAEVYFKYEGANPTGSFKDRGMTMAISKAVEAGAKGVICASTGNTSASAAAYAARAGLKCTVLIPDGKIALGKLSQAIQFGAIVLPVNGNFDEALEFVKKISEKYNITLVNSLNPYRIEGQTTGAYEICDALGTAPDYQFMPVGNAGNISAYWAGYKRYFDAKKTSVKPAMMGYQAAGAAPIVLGHAVKSPETIATAIRIGNPASWKTAEKARDESGGKIDMVTDEEIIAAYDMLSKKEGVFAEPSSCASLAGLIKYCKANKPESGSKIVCILTGNGLKDPDSAIKYTKCELKPVSTMDEILKRMGIQ
ncbi:MAG TPA: threonine synthase [Candidatus Wallbacteria bacterium]|nr:threonine synthase [Candidatus Wallbacteria bacterium]